MATNDHMLVTAVGIPEGAISVSFGAFELESGQVIEDAVICYTAYGKLNEAGDNAIIVGHSLTSNSNVAEWWGQMLGDGAGYSLDTSSDYVVCCNYLGSPYGSSSPLTPDPDKPDGSPYAANFPTPVTIRDNVRLQRALLDRLGVRHLRMAIGGSMGSMLALEWAACYPDYVTELVLIAGCGRHTDWAIGMGEAQRFSIMADAKFNGGAYDLDDPPRAGLATSRMMAMLSYRAPASVDERFSRSVMNEKCPATTSGGDDGGVGGEGGRGGGGGGAGEGGKRLMRKPSVHADLGAHAVAHANEAVQSLPYFAVESYLQYQGKKFIQRFDANCYIQLTYTLDSHDVARGRGEFTEVLRQLTHRTLVVGITSDVLYPYQLQTELADNMPRAELYSIESPHGHDAFLIEIKELNGAIARFRRGERADPKPAPAAGDALDVTEMKVGELGSAVRALEAALDESRGREARERRRADALMAKVAQLKAEAAAAAGVGARGGPGSGAVGVGVGTLTGMVHGIRVVPADPGPSGSRRFQPVFGEVKSSDAGGAAPVAALGAF